MVFYDFIFIGLLIALLRFKDSRFAASVILSAYLVYSVVYPYFPDNYYHALSATVNLFISVALFNRHIIFKIPVISLLSILLIFINFRGYINYKNELPATEYNESYLFIFSLEILILFTRMLINAYIDRRDYKRALVQLVNFDSYETCVKIHKISPHNKEEK